MADAPKEKLYDLDADPWAVKNLINAPTHAEALGKLHQEFTTWRMSTNDNDQLFTMRAGKVTE